MKRYNYNKHFRKQQLFLTHYSYLKKKFQIKKFFTLFRIIPNKYTFGRATLICTKKSEKQFKTHIQHLKKISRILYQSRQNIDYQRIKKITQNSNLRTTANYKQLINKRLFYPKKPESFSTCIFIFICRYLQ